MKRLLPLLSLVFLLAACTTTKVRLPENGTVAPEVLAAFNELHPESTNQVWSIFPDVGYSVRYRVLGFRYRDVLDEGGNLVHTQRSIYEYSLPPAARTLLYETYDDHDIERLSRISFPDGEKVYDVELEDPEKTRFVLRFNEAGELVNRTPATEYRWFME